MGLFASDPKADQDALELFFEGICDFWTSAVTPSSQIQCRVTESGLSICSKVATEIFDGNLASKDPGPFKRAAAIAILALYIPNFIVFSVGDNEGTNVQVDPEKQREWLTRFALSTIAPSLANLKIDATGTTPDVQLDHPWAAISSHFQVELIAWLRMLQPPILDADRSLDLARTVRAILGLSLIIEACYYRLDPKLIGQGTCSSQAAQTHADDLEFDFGYESTSQRAETVGEWHDTLVG
jgi:hypothetical protein